MLCLLSAAGCTKNTRVTLDNHGSNETAGVGNNGEEELKYFVEEVGFERDGLHIYGELFLPENDAPHPLVIISHGFGGNSSQVRAYAEAFAENGIAACIFDFIGGGNGSRSDGNITDMSVLTEAADLNKVMDGLIVREDIDASELYLLGGSQGGFVSTYVAGMRPNDIKALIALYPAYVIHDNVLSRTPDPDSIPETMDLMGITIGRIYNSDAMSFDIYEVMKDYPGDVLIIHGIRDSVVPISYSERAKNVFPSAELVKFEGAGHGFYGRDETRSAEMSVDFVKKHLGDSDNAEPLIEKKITEEAEKMKIKVTDEKDE